MHKSSRNIPELTGSKSDPLKPCTIAIDTDWNINDKSKKERKHKGMKVKRKVQIDE
jgi:hypothetical protein